MLSSEVDPNRTVLFTKGPKSVMADEVRAAEPGKVYELHAGRGDTPAAVRAKLSYAARQCGIKILTKIEGRSVFWSLRPATVDPVGDPPADAPGGATPRRHRGASPTKAKS